MSLFKVFIISVLMLSAIIFSSCITITALNSSSPGYKKDKIQKTETYYSDSLKTLAIVVNGKIKKLKNNEPKLVCFNLDKLYAHYSDNDQYTYRENPFVIGIYKDYDTRNYTDVKVSDAIDFYREAFDIGDFNLNDFEIIKEFKKEQFENIDKSSNKFLLSEFEIDDPKSNDTKNIKVFLYKERKKAWWKYFYLPITVPLDVATSPVQIVLAIVIVSSLKKNL